ncbi:MAG: putative DNA-binding transcriptional regulator AlpA [Sulfurimonas sp.]|jgi:predicted DNA-binding transcriptional regulator AlpA|uniref:helix-turn-helix transcriptional regulator n=1 Tax=Sulfurimonas sp. TaxID=2022749 RepID=UPI0039E3A05E
MSTIQYSEMRQKKYYRARELSQLLGVGLSTIWLYAKEGKLTPKKLSARVTVFDIEEINKLFNSVEVA